MLVYCKCTDLFLLFLLIFKKQRCCFKFGTFTKKCFTDVLEYVIKNWSSFFWAKNCLLRSRTAAPLSCYKLVANIKMYEKFIQLIKLFAFYATRHNGHHLKRRFSQKQGKTAKWDRKLRNTRRKIDQCRWKKNLLALTLTLN